MTSKCTPAEERAAILAATADFVRMMPDWMLALTNAGEIDILGIVAAESADRIIMAQLDAIAEALGWPQDVVATTIARGLAGA